MKILGLSFFYHDSAACLLVDGEPLAMAEEERFSRQKHDSGFPRLSIDFVLREGQVLPQDLDWVVFYEKPFLKFERILKTALATWPLAPQVFSESLKHLFLDKLWIRNLIAQNLKISPQKILFSGHHFSHAASSFFPSPFDQAAILTVDGVGEWATTTLGIGQGNKIKILKEIYFPHSLGLFYSAFTAFLGFEVNDGEYKVMGMAPYGRPKYINQVRKLIKIFDDGSFELNLKYFLFDRSLTKTYSSEFVKLFGRPRDPKSKFFTRDTGWPSYFGPKPEGEEFERLAQEQEYYADIAASLQVVFEEAVIKLAGYLYKTTGLTNLCLAGGCGLNSVANWKIKEETAFEEIFVQPASGDGGGALGAALAVYHQGLGQSRKYQQKHAYFGQKYGLAEIKEFLESKNIKYEFVEKDEEVIKRAADEIIKGKVIGWFGGRFEWGPRALGSRSILADARRGEMKDIVNTKIKFREPYRPFAPSCLAERAGDFFEMGRGKENWPARFMLYVVPVKKEKQMVVPAITHVDGTARPQLVFKEQSPRYWKLINQFYQKTGVGLVLNTSFNLKGEPIVNSPEEALSTMARSEIDMVFLENFIVGREDLPSGFKEQYLKNKPEKKLPGRGIIKKIALLVVSLFVALAALEAGVRIFTKPVYPILRTDAEVGTIHQKNFNGKIWNDEAGAYLNIKTNNLGYIGENWQAGAHPQELRIAMLGDSTTEALGVDYQKNFSSLLQNNLNNSSFCPLKKTLVMNYGVGGTGTFLQYQTYKKNVVPFQPDILVLMFHGNDYADNLNKANYDLENYAGASERQIWLKSFLLQFQLPKYIFSKLGNNILFLRLLNKLGLYEFNEYTKQAFTQGPTSLEQDPSFYSYTFGIIDKLSQRAKENHLQFLIVFLPDEPDYSQKAEATQNQKLIKLKEFAAQQKIAFFDPTEELAQAKKEAGSCLTFNCVGHFNEIGHSAFAKILTDFLETNKPQLNLCLEKK